MKLYEKCLLSIIVNILLYVNILAQRRDSSVLESDDPDCRDTFDDCESQTNKCFKKQFTKEVYATCRRTCRRCVPPGFFNSQNDSVEDGQIRSRKKRQIVQTQRCEDQGADCPLYTNFCTNQYYINFMMQHCPRSCGYCSATKPLSSQNDNSSKTSLLYSPTLCADVIQECAQLRRVGFCESDEHSVEVKRTLCPSTCKLCIPYSIIVNNSSSGTIVAESTRSNTPLSRILSSRIQNNVTDGGGTSLCVDRGNPPLCQQLQEKCNDDNFFDFLYYYCTVTCNLCEVDRQNEILSRRRRQRALEQQRVRPQITSNGRKSPIAFVCEDRYERCDDIVDDELCENQTGRYLCRATCRYCRRSTSTYDNAVVVTRNSLRAPIDTIDQSGRPSDVRERIRPSTQRIIDFLERQTRNEIGGRYPVSSQINKDEDSKEDFARIFRILLQSLKQKEKNDFIDRINSADENDEDVRRIIIIRRKESRKAKPGTNVNKENDSDEENDIDPREELRAQRRIRKNGKNRQVEVINLESDEKPVIQKLNKNRLNKSTQSSTPLVKRTSKVKGTEENKQRNFDDTIRIPNSKNFFRKNNKNNSTIRDNQTKPFFVLPAKLNDEYAKDLSTNPNLQIVGSGKERRVVVFIRGNDSIDEDDDENSARTKDPLKFVNNKKPKNQKINRKPSKRKNIKFEFSNPLNVNNKLESVRSNSSRNVLEPRGSKKVVDKSNRPVNRQTLSKILPKTSISNSRIAQLKGPQDSSEDVSNEFLNESSDNENEYEDEDNENSEDTTQESTSTRNIFTDDKQNARNRRRNENRANDKNVFFDQARRPLIFTGSRNKYADDSLIDGNLKKYKNNNENFQYSSNDKNKNNNNAIFSNESSNYDSYYDQSNNNYNRSKSDSDYSNNSDYGNSNDNNDDSDYDNNSKDYNRSSNFSSNDNSNSGDYGNSYENSDYSNDNDYIKNSSEYANEYGDSSNKKENFGNLSSSSDNSSKFQVKADVESKNISKAVAKGRALAKNVFQQFFHQANSNKNTNENEIANADLLKSNGTNSGGKISKEAPKRTIQSRNSYESAPIGEKAVKDYIRRKEKIRKERSVEKNEENFLAENEYPTTTSSDIAAQGSLSAEWTSLLNGNNSKILNNKPWNSKYPKKIENIFI